VSLSVGAGFIKTSPAEKNFERSVSCFSTLIFNTHSENRVITVTGAQFPPNSFSKYFEILKFLGFQNYFEI